MIQPKTILFLLIVLSFCSKSFTQSDKKTINLELLTGVWSPVDSVYSKMDFKFVCIEITNSTWMTFECINAVSTNTKCPYKIENNEVRVMCDEKEQSHYRIKELNGQRLVINIYFVKANGKLSLIHRNVEYIRRS